MNRLIAAIKVRFRRDRKRAIAGCIIGALGLALAAKGGWAMHVNRHPHPGTAAVPAGPTLPKMQVQEMVRGLDDHSVEGVEFQTRGNLAVLDLAGGGKAEVVLPLDSTWLAQRAVERGAKVSYVMPPVPATGIMDILLIVLNLAFPAFMLWFLWKSTAGMMGGGKSWTWIKPSKVGVGFDDVAGVDEAKESLRDVVAFLKDPSKFEAVGARPRAGILMTGDPGNGKTLLAKATAGEAGVGFMAVQGSDLGGIIVGMGARRIKKLFKKARRHAPVIVFIDEIDAIAGRRFESANGVGTDSSLSVGQMLTELDGMAKRAGVVVIGATNRPEALDPAVTRAGRFDLTVEVPPPNLQARRKILELNAARTVSAPDVDLGMVAKESIGSSGADLANLVNEAAILAAKRGARAVAAFDYEEARMARLLGGVRSGMVLTDEERDIVSVHEASHAIAASALDGCDPVKSATIAPRGRALGLVATSAVVERKLVRKHVLEHRIVMALSGRAGEEEVFGSDMATDGAMSDMEVALRYADEIVSRFGVNDSFDPCVAGSVSTPRDRPVSDASRAVRDDAVREIVLRLGQQARVLVKANRKGIEVLAKRLKAVETVDGKEVRDIHAKHAPPPECAVALAAAE